MSCETWADHEWGPPRYVDGGHHVTMGAFQTVVRRCERCSRTTTETRWVGAERASLTTLRRMTVETGGQ